MRIGKTKLRNVITIAICLIGVTVFSSCSKDEAVNPDNSIIGKWVTSDYNASNNDTITFTSGMRVEDYFMFTRTAYHPADSYYFTYSLNENDMEITSFQPEDYHVSETFAYVLNGDSLTIMGFSNPFSETEEVRTDVHFIRIK